MQCKLEQNEWSRIVVQFVVCLSMIPYLLQLFLQTNCALSIRDVWLVLLNASCYYQFKKEKWLLILLLLYLLRGLNPIEAMVPREMVACQRGLLHQAVDQAPPSSPASCLVVQAGFQEVAAHQLPKRPNPSMISPPSLKQQLQDGLVMILFGALSFYRLAQRRGSEKISSVKVKWKGLCC